jgi:hypothetical protein
VGLFFLESFFRSFHQHYYLAACIGGVAIVSLF